MTPIKPTVHRVSAKPKAATHHVPAKTVASPMPAVTPATQPGRYYQGLGGRKTATAQVRVFPKQTGIQVNGKDFKMYFTFPKHQAYIEGPLLVTDLKNAVGITVHVVGGGINAQAQAVRHGISQALIKLDADLKKKLRRYGFITRDPRHVERKKYGLKKARRAPQWAKR